MSIINRLIFTSKLTERAPTPKQNSLSQVFSSSLDIAKLLAMAKGCAGSQSSLKKQKKLGFVVGRQENSSSCQLFPAFPLPSLLPFFPTAPSRGSFFPLFEFLPGYAKWFSLQKRKYCPFSKIQTAAEKCWKSVIKMLKKRNRIFNNINSSSSSWIVLSTPLPQFSVQGQTQPPNFHPPEVSCFHGAQQRKCYTGNLLANGKNLPTQVFEWLYLSWNLLVLPWCT